MESELELDDDELITHNVATTTTTIPTQNPSVAQKARMIQNVEVQLKFLNTQIHLLKTVRK